MICKFLAENGISRQDLTESNHHKQTARKRESRHRYNLCVQWDRWKRRSSLSLSLPGAPFCWSSPAWSAWLCSLLSLWWSVLAAQQPKSSKTDLASKVCLAGSLWWSVLAAQQPKSSKTDLASLVCLAVLRALPWWSVLPKSPKTDLAMLVCLAELLALPLVVRFAAQQPKSSKTGLARSRQLGLLGCAPCSPSGGPFWPLSSPNPPKRTSPTLPLTAGARRARTLNLR